ncbi:MAG: SRPBCC family protein [Bacteroidota bacterium]
MKTAKKIGISLFAVVSSIVLLGFISSPISITSSTVINASQGEVYQVLSSFDRFPEWSPFLVTDPNQKNWTTGEDGETGSRFYWVGVDEEGEGFQELTEVSGNSSLVMNCTITKPFKSNPTFAYSITAKDTGIEVVQTFEMPSSVLEKMMLGAFGVTSEIEQTNQLGMDRLKTLLES